MDTGGGGFGLVPNSLRNAKNSKGAGGCHKKTSFCSGQGQELGLSRAK